jgi:hypothetical protein
VTIGGGRKGNPVADAVKKVITTFDFASGDTASKYHQSQAVLLMADSWDPSRLHADLKFAVTSPVTAVGRIVLVLESDFHLELTRALDGEHASPTRTHGIKENFIF